MFGFKYFISNYGLQLQNHKWRIWEWQGFGSHSQILNFNYFKSNGGIWSKSKYKNFKRLEWKISNTNLFLDFNDKTWLQRRIKKVEKPNKNHKPLNEQPQPYSNFLELCRINKQNQTTLFVNKKILSKQKMRKKLPRKNCCLIEDEWTVEITNVEQSDVF